MSRCDELRELLGTYLEGDLEEARVAEVREHLDACEECAELAETMQEIMNVGAGLDSIDAPERLTDDLASSPCSLWLRLLFQAVDHEISDSNLQRLLAHLESCEGCRRTWQDLTLIHQVGEAMKPSQYLLRRCISARNRTQAAQPILSRRVAVAAAYVLAVLTSLVVGNPVTLARSQAAPAVERVAEVVTTEVAEAAQQGRGEVRVMLWRAWKWGEDRVDAVRALFRSENADEETRSDAASTGDEGESS
jgi:anti-sigma factor RsiW